MAKGNFRSSDYVFRDTPIGAAMRSLGVANPPMVREPALECNGKTIHARPEQQAA